VTQTEEEAFDPWGRPGGGAPITNENGKVVTATQQHFNGKKEVSNINMCLCLCYCVFTTANW